MRRQAGTRAALLVVVTTLLAVVTVTVTPAAAAAAPTTPTAATTTPPPTSASPSPTGSATGSPTGSATPTPTATPTVAGPSDRGIPATFTERLTELQKQATTMQADLAAKKTAADTAIATYTATTKKVQQALDDAATAQQQLAQANTEVDAARTQVQVLARDTYVERPPAVGSALLLTANVDDVDFTVAALGYLADRGAAVYDQFTVTKAKAESFATAQADALAQSTSLQVTADTQRATALTALGVAQAQQAAFVAAVTSLRTDAAAAAAAAPLSPSDTAAYQAFLAQLTALGGPGGGLPTAAGGTTYVTGGPGLTPLPGTAWVRPLVKYTVSSCYCARWGTFHHGVDLSAPEGTPIYAVGAGTVVAAGPANGFGNWVVIDHHDGSFSIYGHMRVLATVVGAQVAPGALIAYVGSEGESTGFHLHFEVRIGSYASGSDSTDPTLWLAQRGVTL